MKKERRIKRRTHCYRGHEFTPENTVWANDHRSKEGRRRQCRKCKQVSHMNWQRDRKIERILGPEALARG